MKIFVLIILCNYYSRVSGYFHSKKNILIVSEYGEIEGKAVTLHLKKMIEICFFRLLNTSLSLA